MQVYPEYLLSIQIETAFTDDSENYVPLIISTLHFLLQFPLQELVFQVHQHFYAQKARMRINNQATFLPPGIIFL